MAMRGYVGLIVVVCGLLAGSVWGQPGNPADSPAQAEIRPDVSVYDRMLLPPAERSSLAGAAPMEAFAAGGTPTTAPATARSESRPAPAATEASYTPWRLRRGPAYPGDFWHSLGRDGKEAPAVLWDDTVACAKSPVVWVGFAFAGAAGIVLNASEVDAHIASHYERHGPQLSDGWDQTGSIAGNPATHFGLAGLGYLGGSLTGDDKLYETSKTAISALALNGITTLVLKFAVNNDSPNGEELAWPSGHTSSSFALATVVAKAYGPLAGVPAYAMATFVGYERIDAGEHWFSDVISGMLIGTAIGWVVGDNHEQRIFGFELVPYLHPEGGAGLALVRDW